jgi:hypothetical protein
VRRLALAALLVPALALGAAGPAAARRHHRPTCFPRRSKTLFRGSGVRVYTVQHNGSDGKIPVAYGCLLKRRVPEILDYDSSTEDSWAGFIVAGHFLAYGFSGDCQCADMAPSPQALGVADLSGRTAGRDEDLGPLGSAAAVLKTDGAVAWIEPTSDPDNPFTRTGYELFKDDAPLGRRQLDSRTQLDSGNGIDPQSLGLHGSTLAWTNAGQAKTATLR